MQLLTGQLDLHEAVTGPGGPCIDHLYVGHLAQLGPKSPVTINMSNQLWHDMIGSRAEATEISPVKTESNINELGGHKAL